VEEIRKGDRFILTRDLATTGLSEWHAPATGSFETVLPAETVVVVNNGRRPGFPGFGCRPERYEELEASLVPEEERSEEKYRGYYFVFNLADIGDSLRRLPALEPPGA
jgi:hypothetical protein